MASPARLLRHHAGIHNQRRTRDATREALEAMSHKALVDTIAAQANTIRDLQHNVEQMRQVWDQGMSSDMAQRLASISHLERAVLDQRRALDAMTRRAKSAEAGLKAAGINFDA